LVHITPPPPKAVLGGCFAYWAPSVAPRWHAPTAWPYGPLVSPRQPHVKDLQVGLGWKLESLFILPYCVAPSEPPHFCLHHLRRGDRRVHDREAACLIALHHEREVSTHLSMLLIVLELADFFGESSYLVGGWMTA
jgi:hypothetical protein